jgi:ABC-type glycerol-3-phosphate transport system substrate-binding protein
MFGINSASKVKEAAWRFLKYLSSTEGQLVYSRQMGRAPSLRSAFPEFRTMFPKRSVDYIISGMMEGEIFPVTFMNVNANNLIHKTIVEQIATNKKPPLQAMDEIAEAINALVK